MKLSIVATLYNSEIHVEAFCQRACSAARTLVADDFEIILVNDGSPDSSLHKALALMAQYPQLIVLDLSRNFGHHKAMMTGLMHARGDQVFLIDSDLEEAPEWLLAFAQTKRDTGCDVVFGVQQRRKGKWFERVSGLWFYRIFRWLTGMQLPTNLVIARLMTSQYVHALVLHEDRDLFMPGLWVITGFAQVAVPVVKTHSSKTTYTLRRKIALAVNSITSFSNVPLICIFYLGLFVLFLAGAYMLSLTISHLVFKHLLSEWTLLMASLWLLGGLVLSVLGIIGIYLSKIFVEIKRRPYSIVKQVHATNKPVQG